jgi:hypothetical protein
VDCSLDGHLKKVAFDHYLILNAEEWYGGSLTSNQADSTEPGNVLVECSMWTSHRIDLKLNKVRRKAAPTSVELSSVRIFLGDCENIFKEDLPPAFCGRHFWEADVLIRKQPISLRYISSFFMIPLLYPGKEFQCGMQDREDQLHQKWQLLCSTKNRLGAPPISASESEHAICQLWKSVVWARLSINWVLYTG